MTVRFGRHLIDMAEKARPKTKTQWRLEGTWHDGTPPPSTGDARSWTIKTREVPIGD